MRAALEGLGWFHRRLARSQGLIDVGKALTEREQQLLSELLTGKSEKEIASQVGLTRATTHQHIMTIYRKFGVRSRAELMALSLSDRSLPQ